MAKHQKKSTSKARPRVPSADYTTVLRTDVLASQIAIKQGAQALAAAKKALAAKGKKTADLQKYYIAEKAAFEKQITERRENEVLLDFANQVQGTVILDNAVVVGATASDAGLLNILQFQVKRLKLVADIIKRRLLL